MNRYFALIFVLIFSVVSAQNTETLRLKKYEVAQLSDTIKETSALNFFQGKLYTLNDSGNTSELFEIDSVSGKIVNVLKTGLINKDWEALTSDENHFYIGDFGNNSGSRKDLKIYQVPFKNDSLQKDSIRTISFFYPEQKDFSPKNINNNFDAEAMIFLNGKVHIFTKEWVSKGVSHYVVDINSIEPQPTQKTEYFQTDFVVTDAAYFQGKLYFVGYTKGAAVYMMIFQESKPGVFFEKPPKKFHMGSAFSIGQIEGIAINENGIYISGEEFSSPLGKSRQRLYFIPDHKKTEVKHSGLLLTD